VPKRSNRAVDQVVDGSGVPHVSRVRDPVTTRGPDQLDGRACGLGVDVVDDDAPAGGGETQRTGPTDPRPGPGDHHHAPVELPRRHARRLSQRQNAAMDELRFDGRVVAITGAHHGLGREHALFLARAGPASS